MRSSTRRQSLPNVSLIVSTLTLVLVVAVATVIYRGPSPNVGDSDLSRPSAGRMRQTLVQLIGESNEPHSLGTIAGVEFLERLESHIESLGHATQRIEIPLAEVQVPSPWSRRLEELPEGTLLRNLIVTVKGRDETLDPLLIATHHDSCAYGPGAGDAGIGVVALVEHLRIMAIEPPKRTTLYLFTDGEEYGLLGAWAIAKMDPPPFAKPCFVINLDARGCSGGAPMFETHQHNRVAVSELVSSLAFPKMTSSLAVTVYRLLPNATDFSVWDRELGWPGFNFAVIGGAHRYHRPEDIPANVSDRTLQHMCDHLCSLHAAIDAAAVDRDKPLDRSSNRSGEAVFFDLLGMMVVQFSSGLQAVLAVTAILMMLAISRRLVKRENRLMVGQLVAVVMLVVLLCCLIGSCAIGFLWMSPWHGLRYTPVDHAAGLVTMVVTCLLVMLGLEAATRRKMNWSADVISEAVWLGVSVLGVVLSRYLPGGAYLLVLPGFAYAVTRGLSFRFPASTRIAAWCGWFAMILLSGPLLTLLVQALGPWKQPVYAVIAGLLMVVGMTTWLPYRTALIRRGTSSRGS